MVLSMLRNRRQVNSKEEENEEGPVGVATGKPKERRWKSVMRAHPSIFVPPLMVLLVLLAAGLLVAFILDRSQKKSMESDVRALAEDTGQLFSQLLDQSLLPLFSLAQFVSEIGVLQTLPAQIGAFDTEGSLPFRPDKPTHRNVTGVCNDPQTLDRFNQIASVIKRNAKMEGILVNLQLAPQAVVCMVYPLNNTEDFPDGTFLDNSGAVGHDLLWDPARRFIAEATVPSDDLVIAGPLTLSSCKDCTPTVSKALIARFPIYSSEYNITVNDVSYPRWGFAVAIISWEAAVAKSGIYITFEEAGLDFQLTRTDSIVSPNGETTEKVVVLAESPDFEKAMEKQYRTVSAALETTNNQWVMTIAYGCGYSAAFVWTILASSIFAVSISLLLLVVLVQKQTHAEIRAEQTALLINNARQAAIAERELNEFIAHEVRNPLSAALSACNFVSTAVHEKQPMKTPAAQQAVRDDVHIIENSLRFINDLLRSMLDIHKAQDKQLVLHLDTIDILHDILEPVEAMLYRRDEQFTVIVECNPKRILIEADRLRLQQVVLNLGRNAAKFVESGYVRLRANVQDGNVRIYVEDSGPGVPAEKRKNLFCRFQESLDSMAQGTGVGLNLCKSLVDLMGGEIWLDESFDSGTEGRVGTRIVVDLKKPPAIAELGESTANFEGCDSLLEEGDVDPAALPKNLKVMFVDDDRILRKLGVRSLRKVTPCWKVREAANGETALQLAETETFDLIFMDQYMTSAEQALKGTETVRALRAMGVNSVICGLSANNLEDTFVTAGADGFILKPFPCKEEALSKELSRLLSLRQTTENLNTSSKRLTDSSAVSGVEMYMENHDGGSDQVV